MIALIDAADAPQWQTWMRPSGWQVIVGQLDADASGSSIGIDTRVQALAAAVKDAIHSGTVDPARVYLAGRGDTTSAVFYTISRVSDLWAAAVVIGGSPKPAFDTNRVFAANFTLVPILWLAGQEAKSNVEKLAESGIHVELRPLAANSSPASLVEWLGQHKRDAFPSAVDCETNSPTFGSCSWIQMTKFDPAERNDVLPSTRIPGGAGASLDLGGFSFKADDPGPGLLVGTLVPRYDGPLKLGDRLLAIEGKPIANAQAYAQMLEKYTEEKPVTVTVLRGKERLRVETRILLPRRETGVTARVQAQFLPAERELQIVSRTITELRVTVPPAWVPASLSWNGVTLDAIKQPGCLLLSVDKELLHASKCP